MHGAVIGRQHTNIRVVPVVEEPPEDGHQSIQDRYPSIERQLRYLGSRELSISIAELDDSRVLAGGIGFRKHAVVAVLVDIVLDRLGVLKVYRVGEDEVLGSCSRIVRQDELPNVLFLAKTSFDELGLADADFLRGIRAGVDPDQVLVLPLEDDKADNGVVIARVG